MAPCAVVKDVYGPGTYTDTDFTPVPQEARRLLKHFAEQTPGFRSDDAFLDNVEFTGDDLPMLPGPIKAQALVSSCD